MRGQRTTGTGSGTRLLAVAALPAGLVASTALAAALGVRLGALLPVDAATASVDRVVEIGVVAVGLALVAWLVWGLAVATACALARALGLSWKAGERAVARHAPALVRRALVVALGAGLGVTGAAGANAATPVDSLDIGWSTTSAATTGGDAAGATTAPPADEQPSPEITADPGNRSATAPAPTSGAEPPASRAPVVPPSGTGAGPEDTESRRATASTATGARVAAAATTSDVAGTTPPPAHGAGTTPPPAHGAGTTPPPAADTATPRTPPDASSSSATPTAPTGAAASSAASADPGAPPADALGATDPGTVVVAVGDTLWGIAQRALGPDATDQQVAAEWPRWYAANADVIGADPDRVVPGQVLRAPGSAPTPGGTR